MKNQNILGMILLGALATATVEAKPLIFTDSTHNELKVAYANKDLAAVQLKYATVETHKFCVANHAHMKGDWEHCVIAITTLELMKRMKATSPIHIHTRY